MDTIINKVMNFEIPPKISTREVTDLSKLTEKDDTYFPQDIPIKLRAVLTGKIQSTNETTMSEVTKLINTANKSKQNYCKGVLATYSCLKKELEKCIGSGSNKFAYSVFGGGGSCWQTPSLDYWLNSNQAKKMAILLFMEELTTKGYSPSLSLNSFTVDHDDGMYDGGDTVTVECKL